MSILTLFSKIDDFFFLYTQGHSIVHFSIEFSHQAR